MKFYVTVLVYQFFFQFFLHFFFVGNKSFNVKLSTRIKIFLHFIVFVQNLVIMLYEMLYFHSEFVINTQNFSFALNYSILFQVFIPALVMFNTEKLYRDC